MHMLVGMPLPDSKAPMVIPKLGYTLQDVIFAVGSEDIVKQMRKEGWLKPISEKPMLFDVGDVQRAWQRFKNNFGEVQK